MREAAETWAKQDEFREIFMVAPGTPESRPVMSLPPRVIATKKFERELQGVIDDASTTTDIADWVVDKMERFGAAFAEPMFDMEGNGPTCSWCKAIWPLCGHQHQSLRLAELDQGGDDVDA